VVLTNPPFGTKGANQAPDRDDFTVSTSNKQLNFVQHVLTILKPGGRAAVVLPDNCLFADQAGEVFQIVTEDCGLHTVLRLPRGTFTPYSQGVKANVVFFTKGVKTEQTWIYDARTNVPGITKKDRPLTPAHFTEFEKCYGPDPDGRAKRKSADSKDDRWRSFSIAEVKQRRVGARQDLDAWERIIGRGGAPGNHRPSRAQGVPPGSRDLRVIRSLQVLGDVLLVSEQAHGSAGVEEALLRHHGRPVRAPQRPEWRPGAGFLAWHGREVFKGAARHVQASADDRSF
jgi:hypothetical protein